MTTEWLELEDALDPDKGYKLELVSGAGGVYLFIHESESSGFKFYINKQTAKRLVLMLRHPDLQSRM